MLYRLFEFGWDLSSVFIFRLSDNGHLRIAEEEEELNIISFFFVCVILQKKN